MQRLVFEGNVAMSSDLQHFKAFVDAVYADKLTPDARWRQALYLDYLFGDFDLRNRVVLDVGAGSGYLGFCAAWCGARRVVCLEPESHGAVKGIASEFNSLKRRLGMQGVELIPSTIQAFDAEPNEFDVILLHNSINHLDEQACIDLHRDANARRVYLDLFRKLYFLVAPGGKVVITDVSRRNFFNDMRRRNPFAPTIEWHKHQPPEIWSELLCESGFRNPSVTWTPKVYTRVGNRLLGGNKVLAYFLTSHFRLTVDRQ